MRIGRFDLDQQVLVMAEIGNNHEGRPEVARELVERAAEAGAGAVKLQVFEAARFVRPRDRERLEQLSRFQLAEDEIAGLCALAHDLGLIVVATPLDLETVAFVEPLVDGLKVASGDNDFYPLIDRVAATGLPLVISSGLAELEEIRAAKEVAERHWAADGTNQEIAVLHCVSAYPVSEEGADLARIPVLAEALDCTIGYSDHTLGIDACVAAAGLGARVIEKHFTLDRDFSKFRDHQLSAEPRELAELVRRAAAVAAEPAWMETPPDQAQARRAQEDPNREVLRRSIVAAADLADGHRLAPDDLTWMRPRDGLAPGQEDQLVGRELRRDVGLGESILPADVGQS